MTDHSTRRTRNFVATVVLLLCSMVTQVSAQSTHTMMPAINFLLEEP